MEPSLRGRVRDGDPDAFGVLFDNYSRAVYNLAFRLTGSWVEAEEVVSLTFLEAWRLRARVEPDGESLRPWLMGITVNVVRNFSRATRRHKAAMARLPEPTAVPDFADELAEHIDDTARLAALRAAFGRLVALGHAHAKRVARTLRRRGSFLGKLYGLSPPRRSLRREPGWERAQHRAFERQRRRRGPLPAPRPPGAGCRARRRSREPWRPPGPVQ